MKQLAGCLLALAGLSGCATSLPVGGRLALASDELEGFTPHARPRTIPAAPKAEPTFLPVPEGGREQVVTLARGLVGKPKVELSGQRFPDDCTGLVVGVYRQLGMDLFSAASSGDNGVTAIYRFAQRHGRVYEGGWPVAGDLVFFKETYDLNRDGHPNDGLTHVGLVDEVRPDGTVIVIHRVRRGVVRYHMNLKHRDVRADPATGKIWNDRLRAQGLETAGVLTGQLFAAFATVLPPESQLARR